jgi:hypothetical protein
MEAAGINQDIIDRVIVDDDMECWGPAKHFLEGDRKDRSWDDFKKTLPGLKDQVLEHCAPAAIEEPFLYCDMDKVTFNQKMKQMFDASDIDGDGKLTEDERKLYLARVMKAAGKGEDDINKVMFGDLSVWEPAAFFMDEQAWNSWEELKDKLDQKAITEDSMVTPPLLKMSIDMPRKEFRDACRAIFDKIDTDFDGVLD